MPGLTTPRAQYAASIQSFVDEASASILGALAASSGFDIEVTQRDVWDATFEYLVSVGVPTLPS